MRSCRHPLIVTLAAGALSWPSLLTAQSLPGPTPIPPWQEPFEVDLNTQEQVRAQGLFIHKSWIDCDGVTCTLTLEPLRFLGDDPTRPLCDDLAMKNKPHLDTAAGSAGHQGGVLVGPDLFLTVHNLSQSACLNRRIVFDYAATGPASPLLAALSPGETLDYTVPATQVRACEEVLAGGSTQAWTLIRLSEPVTDRQPLKLMRSGRTTTGATTRVAGFPSRLPLKIEEASITSDNGIEIETDAHILGGSSGSAVLGPSNRLEGVVCCGSGWLNEIGDCYGVIENPSPNAGLDRPSGQSLALIPPIGLDVVSIDPEPENPLRIAHHGPPGGPFTEGALAQTLRAGSTGQPVDWVISLPLGPVHYFAPAPGTPLSGHLEPGETVPLMVEPTLDALAAPVGTFTSWIAYIDQTYGTIDVQDHVLVVGGDSFARTCVDGALACREDGALIGSGPSGLIAGETQTYQLSSRWDVAQRIEIDHPSWLEVLISVPPPSLGAGNHAAEGFDLVPGATLHVTLTMVDDGPNGSFEDSVVLRSSFAGEPMHSESMLVRGDVGRVVVDAQPLVDFAQGERVELPTLLPPTKPTAALDVDFCIQVWPTGPVFGEPSGPPSLSLRGPSGLEIPLGDHWGSKCFSHDVFSPIPVPTIAVPGLASFAGEDASGTWTLIVEGATVGDWPMARISATSWRVRIAQP